MDECESGSTNESTVGLYCGTFNPFHKGHYNIYQKASRIFDKVIVAKGVNSEKARSKRELSPIEHMLLLRYGSSFYPPAGITIKCYNGLTTELIKSYRKIYDRVVLVRGLRNSFDFAKEAEQSAILRRLLPDIDIVYISCDIEFSDISSTTVRDLSSFDEAAALALLPINN